MKIGIGYDIHRLVEERKLFLGGVEIPYVKGLIGYSDGDVMLHAISDALLGALGQLGVNNQLFFDFCYGVHRSCVVFTSAFLRNFREAQL